MPMQRELYPDDWEEIALAVKKEADEEEKVPNLRAEIDGLKWAVEERDELVHDFLAAYFDGIECNLGDCRDCSHRDWPNPCEGWLLFDRAEQAGVEV